MTWMTKMSEEEDDILDLNEPVSTNDDMEVSITFDELLDDSETSETDLPASIKRKQEDDTEASSAKEPKLETQIFLPVKEKLAVEQSGGQKYQLRGYQREISQKILKGENDIIIMPTGTGKTAVAANLVLRHLEQRSGESVKVLFLVPRVVLVEQQLDAIQQYIGDEWKDKCRRMSGADLDSMETLKNLLTEKEYAVIVATPQIILNYFYAFERSTMRDFTLIIFDECHNARGNDPYNKLLEEYMKERAENPDGASKLPQLVGMTATVGIGGAKTGGEAQNYIMDVCSKLSLGSLPSEIVEYKDELNSVMDEPMASNEDVESVRLDPFSNYLREVMRDIISDVKENLERDPAWKSVKIKFRPPAKDMLSLSLVQTIKEAISGLTAAAKFAQSDPGECIKHLKHLQVYHQALQWANLARLSNSMEYLEEEMEKNDLQNCKFLKKYRETYADELRQRASREDEKYPNKKLLVLKKELDKVLKKERMDDGSMPRIMVFVEHRRLASMISDWLSSLGDEYKSKRFVSSLQSSTSHGMTAPQAKEVMGQFKEGELNILVATSVLSEGLDIPECNCVIRYMYIKDVIAEVQVPGRVRSKNGTIVAIFDQKLKDQYDKTKIMEKRMDLALKNIRGMSDKDFRAEVNKRRTSLYRGIQRETSTGKKLVADVQIACKNCLRRVGQLQDVCRYMAVHYITIDSQLQDKVDLVPDGAGDTYDAMTECGVVVCKKNGCSVLGDIFRIKLSTDVVRRVVKWIPQQVVLLESDGNRKPVKKWTDITAKYAIRDIKQEELTDLASANKLMETN
ncbi:ATP-dependent RNA helicase DHX58-like [Watersipora subatra]|uniref:ATP-dependent RNA helicase DHX58-like n=1 Tax=Watersipora subatra TaxID=2589382 RepID=UPI00355C1DC7